MTDYARQQDFSVKDALASGDPEKVILGADMDEELDALVTAVASKLDDISGGTDGQLTTIGSSGAALSDSGIDKDDVLQVGLTKNLTVGITTDIEAIGNSGTGTVTPSFATENIKTLTVNGSFTLGEPSATGACIIIVTNDGTGGYTITTTGYETIGSGVYVNTASAKNYLFIMKEGSNSYLSWLTIA